MERETCLIIQRLLFVEKPGQNQNLLDFYLLIGLMEYQVRKADLNVSYVLESQDKNFEHLCINLILSLLV